MKEICDNAAFEFCLCDCVFIEESDFKCLDKQTVVCVANSRQTLQNGEVRTEKNDKVTVGIGVVRAIIRVHIWSAEADIIHGVFTCLFRRRAETVESMPPNKVISMCNKIKEKKRKRKSIKGSFEVVTQSPTRREISQIVMRVDLLKARKKW